MLILTIISLSFFLGISQGCSPSGVHISLGDLYAYTDALNSTSHARDPLKIMFFTSKNCSNTYILIRDSNNTFEANITHHAVTEFNITDNSQDNLAILIQYIHTYKLTSTLMFGKKYYYTIFPNTNSSDTSSFTFDFILPYRDLLNDTSKETNILFTGMMDISNESSYTRQYLNSYAKRLNSTSIDAIIYLGDMAFNLNDNLYKKGNNFFNDIQSFTAYIPFMPTAGIRDNANDYEYYNKMIGSPLEEKYEDFVYSFNLGYAHFVQFNMAFYFSGSNETLKTSMLNWLENDLKIANQKTQRMARPWVIVYGYRSFYCSNTSDSFCGSHEGNAADVIKFENLFVDHAVDIYISGSNLPVYERTKPLYKKTEYAYGSNIAFDVNFEYMVNPKAPIYLIDSCGGNNLYFNGATELSIALESYDKGIYSLRADPWQGFGIMTIKSATVIEFIQISSYDYTLYIPDKFTLINNMTKWEDAWVYKDKVTFITSFIFFVFFGVLILIIFMMSIEKGN